MATPQLEDGYTRIADEILDALIAYRLPGEQIQCLWFIIRKTYGFNKKWDMISNSQFVKATGMAKQSVNRALKGLIDKKVVNKKVDNYIPSYEFNKHYKTWKVSTKRFTVNKKVSQASTKRCPTIDSLTIDNKRFKFKIKVPIPKNFHLTDQMVEYAKKKRYNQNLENFTEQFIKNCKSNGRKYKDWYSAWQNWLLNDIKWNPNHQDKERELV